MAKHKHKDGFEFYGCQAPECRAARLISSSVEDLASSLASYRQKDLDVLEIALKRCKRSGRKTMASKIAARIKKIQLNK